MWCKFLGRCLNLFWRHFPGRSPVNPGCQAAVERFREHFWLGNDQCLRRVTQDIGAAAWLDAALPVIGPLGQVIHGTLW
jgi:hypothetical protein